MNDEPPSRFSFYPNGTPFDAPKDGGNSYSFGKKTSTSIKIRPPFDTGGIEMAGRGTIVQEPPYSPNTSASDQNGENRP